MDDQTIHNRRWAILVVLCLSLVLIIVGNTVLNVAIPTLIRELHATNSQVQWMVDAYGLVFAGLLLFSGALGDRFGRKYALQAGLLIFGGAALVATFATKPGDIILTRAVMGLGAALVMPATLSILTNVFPPEERAKAIGIWAGLSGVGAAVGPVAAGYLIEHFYWGSVFYLNLPVVVIALISGWFLVPNSRDEAQPPLDIFGALLSVGGLGALLYGIIEAPVYGWTDPAVLTGFISAAIVLSVFAWWELHTASPMLDLRNFRNRHFSSATTTITLIFFAMFAVFFVLTQYFQLVLNYSPLEAGVRTTPFMLGFIVSAPLSAKLVESFGVKRIIALGMVIVTAALLYFSTFGASTPYLSLAISFVILAFGMGLAMAPATTAIMASLPLGKAGVGSAVNDTSRELGGALGVAVLGSLLASKYTSLLGTHVANLTHSAQVAAKSSLGEALQVGTKIGGTQGQDLIRAAQHAYVNGMQLSIRIGAAIVIAATVLVVVFMPNEQPSFEPVHEHLDFTGHNEQDETPSGVGVLVTD